MWRVAATGAVGPRTWQARSRAIRVSPFGFQGRPRTLNHKTASKAWSRNSCNSVGAPARSVRGTMAAVATASRLSKRDAALAEPKSEANLFSSLRSSILLFAPDSAQNVFRGTIPRPHPCRSQSRTSFPRDRHLWKGAKFLARIDFISDQPKTLWNQRIRLRFGLPWPCRADRQRIDCCRRSDLYFRRWVL